MRDNVSHCGSTVYFMFDREIGLFFRISSCGNFPSSVTELDSWMFLYIVSEKLEYLYLCELSHMHVNSRAYDYV